jgi:chromate transporter
MNVKDNRSEAAARGMGVGYYGMTSTCTAASPSPAPLRVSFGEAVRVWARIGLLGFGGPAGQIALMHRELVERRRWISESRFLHALNYCMLLPGPEAQQLATYIGWLLHRTPGGLVAGTLFVLPGFVAILALSLVYATFQHTPAVDALFFGLKAAVLAIVLEAVIRIGRRALRSRVHIAVAAAAFVAIFLLHVPFPLIVLGAALVGLVAGAPLAAASGSTFAHGAHANDDAPSVIDAMMERGELHHTAPSLARAIRITATCLVLWFAPLVALAHHFGAGHVFVTVGAFFSKAAVVTFGGAYAVLAYVAQRAVETYGWLRPGEMLDGLGMAETTPGPLIMVVQFVGFMAALRNAGPLDPLLAGVIGSLVTVWVTFVPCFLWIFLGAPYIEALRGSRRLAAALSSITAAVVGVILDLTVWFALHTLFAGVTEWHFGPARLLVPVWTTLSVPSLVLAVAAVVAMLRFRLGLGWTLAASAAFGLLWKTAG